MISIILPTYNEKENIIKLISAVLKILKEENIEILVIDDDSPDKTAMLVKQKFRKNKQINVLIRKNQRGLASAVVFGVSNCQGDRIVVMDSDFSHPPEIIPELIDGLNHCDLVIASRFAKGGKMKMPLIRQIISLGAKSLSFFLTRVSDPMSGYFAFQKKILAGTELKPKGYKILLEILVRSRVDLVKEVPYNFKDRLEGKSKISQKVIFEYLQQIAELYYFKINEKLF
jgi:dolichol-phosphate mannosyltransferase